MVSGHGDLRRAEHGNHTRLSVTKLANSPSLGGNSDDPVTQSLCTTAPPATLDPGANGVGGFTSLRDHHNKQTGPPKTSSHRTNVQTTANGDSLLGFDLTQRGGS